MVEPTSLLNVAPSLFWDWQVIDQEVTSELSFLVNLGL